VTAPIPQQIIEKDPPRGGTTALRRIATRSPHDGLAPADHHASGLSPETIRAIEQGDHGDPTVDLKEKTKRLHRISTKSNRPYATPPPATQMDPMNEPQPTTASHAQTGGATPAIEPTQQQPSPKENLKKYGPWMLCVLLLVGIMATAGILMEKVKFLTRQVDGLNQAVQERDQALAIATDQLQKTQTQAKSTTDALAKTRSEAQDLTLRQQGAEQRWKDAAERLPRLEENLRQLEADRTAADARNKQLQTAYEQAKAEAADAAQAAKRLQTTVDTYKNEVELAKGEASTYRRKLSDATASLEMSTQLAEKADKAIKSRDAKIKALQEENDRLKGAMVGK
jgi:predicted  nucleic acid-binding Zn-ribbon protein